MPPMLAMLTGLAAFCAVLALVWLVQLRTHNAALVDPVWSLSLGLLGVLYACLGNGDGTARLLLGVMSLVWGGRLGGHLLARHLGHPEDGRYASLRQTWGAQANRRMLAFFMAQAVLGTILSLGFVVVAYRSSTPTPLAIVAALVIWAVSIVGEALADAQLSRFRRAPANHRKVCRAGLWRYSRHPNYFFECLHWLSYCALALGSPWVWLTLTSPVVMAWLLLKVSGVPATEAQAARSRPDYAEYVRTTSALIPWPPRRPRHVT